MYFEEICALIDRAIQEDIRSGDITSQVCVDPKEEIEGVFILKQEGVLAGLSFLEEIFTRISSSIRVDLLAEEGVSQHAGTLIATISGNAQGILSAERVALNFLQHASGIATKTAEFVEELEGFDCDVLNTRNTVPGMRCLERHAVEIGGGKSHRTGLDEWFIIKPIHLFLLQKQYDDPIMEAVERARNYNSEIVIEIQVEDLRNLEKVIGPKPDIILLNHMNPQEIARAVKKIRKHGNTYIEVTGDIDLNTIVSYAESGVDGISIPELTRSVSGLDISFRFKV